MEIIMKKQFAAALMLAMGISANALAEPTVMNHNGNITVSGNTTPKTTVTLTVKSADDDSGIYALKETVSDSDGNFGFDFILRDRNTEQNVYKYLLSIKSDSVYEKKLNIFSESAVESFAGSIKSGNADSLYSLIESDSNNIAESLGMNISEYMFLSENEKKDLCAAFYKDINDDYVGIFNTEVTLYKAKAADKDSYTKLMNEMFEKYNLSEFTRSRIEATRNYSCIKEFDEEAARFESLNKINNAKYTQLAEIYTENESVLGLSDSADYKTYQAMNDTKRRKADEAVISAVVKQPAESVESFIKTFGECVAAANKSDSGTGGGGGGSSSGGGSYPGGRGSSKNNSSVIINNNEEIKKPEKQPVFNDIALDFWAYDSIERLADKNIINGYEDGSFKPGKTVTREEFITMLINAFGKYDKSAECAFEDVPSGSWFYSYAASGFKAGIISGISESLFGTGLEITRQDAAVMLARAIGAENGDGSFSDDSEIADYAKGAVYALKDKGIISGREDGSFDPYGKCTRAECAVMISKAID